jgi:maltooligosyltrehalose trehalohydrolase
MQGRTVKLPALGGGRFGGAITAHADEPYSMVIDGRVRPDPASRAQITDVHGASRLSDPSYHWPESEDQWRGHALSDLVILELHVGLFTPEGTFAAAEARLPELAALGFTAIEIMPVNHFAGQRGWGYDGVLPFAPHPVYGPPDALKSLVAAAHATGLSVILDVVWNHFGPDGGYLHEIAPDFFDPDRDTPWGAGIDFAREEVRAYFGDNARMWVEEFHMDGLRIDAAHQIRGGTPGFLDAVARDLRARTPDRPLHLILEDERNLVTPRQPGSGLFDAEWNDDYHHAVHCLLTGESESYYASFAVDPLGDLARALAEGQVEQGQPREGLEHPRGEPSGALPVTAFVNSNQTHDQVGNRAQGERLIVLAGQDAARVAHALLLLSPYIPMLFMGEEAGETAPFQFFADFTGDLAEATRNGRAREFARFESFGGPVPDPMAKDTFERSRPYRDDTDRTAEWRALTRELLHLRHDRIAPLVAANPCPARSAISCGDRALQARFDFGPAVLILDVALGAAGRFEGRSSTPLFALGDPATDPYSLTVWIEETS